MEVQHFARCCSIHTAGRRWIAAGWWLRGRWQHLPPVGPQVPQDLQETESFLPSFRLPVASSSSQRHSQHLRKPAFSFAWALLRSASLHPQLVCAEVHNLLFAAERKQLTTGATCDLTAWQSKGYRGKGRLWLRGPGRDEGRLWPHTWVPLSAAPAMSQPRASRGDGLARLELCGQVWPGPSHSLCLPCSCVNEYGRLWFPV